MSISPVFDGEGRLTNFVGVQADVTARVAAEREREIDIGPRTDDAAVIAVRIADDRGTT